MKSGPNLPHTAQDRALHPRHPRQLSIGYFISPDLPISGQHSTTQVIVTSLLVSSQTGFAHLRSAQHNAGNRHFIIARVLADRICPSPSAQHKSGLLTPVLASLVKLFLPLSGQHSRTHCSSLQSAIKDNLWRKFGQPQHNAALVTSISNQGQPLEEVWSASAQRSARHFNQQSGVTSLRFSQSMTWIIRPAYVRVRHSCPDRP